PIATSNFSTALTIYDSLGNGHIIEIYFQKSADNTWNWFVTARANELDGMSGDGLVTVASGTMSFTDSGALDTIVTTADSSGPLSTPVQGATVSFDFAGGAQLGQTVTFDFGTPRRLFDGSGYIDNPDAPTDFDGSTQFASPSATLFQSQDGFRSGVLQSFRVNEQGIIQGLFSNGQTLDLMQVALAKFPSPTGLNLVGQNLYSQSERSGDPVVSGPGTSGLGVVVSNALEISNVDLSSQFVELIRAQQAFQANARVITTGDQLLSEVVNLRR
ncbi:MAG: flagellar hook-basal body complex protein, partial [Nitrospinota bacterium]